jgi:hypothetical protein
MDRKVVFVDTIGAGLQRRFPRLDRNDAGKIAVEIYEDLAEKGLVEPILPKPPAPIPFRRP